MKQCLLTGNNKEAKDKPVISKDNFVSLEDSVFHKCVIKKDKKNEIKTDEIVITDEIILTLTNSAE